MRMLKKCFALLLVVAVFTVMTVNAVDFSEAENVQPRYTGIFDSRTSLDISSFGKANVYGYVHALSGYTVDVTVSLIKDETSIKSWSDSGNGGVEISKNYYVTSGHSYYTSLYVEVYNSSNKLVDSFTIYSDAVNY
ncbi:MAG: hypothetical protein HFF90_07915 [Oscillibacter sp.]|nr:hypothetical protein [Oscillibacter sp.]